MSDTNRNSAHRPTPEPADAPALLADFVQQITRLFQNEIALAKKEVSQKMSRAAFGIGLIALAAFLVFSALDVLSAALVAALAEMGLPVSVASLIVAATTIIIAFVLFRRGMARLNPDNLAPSKSIQNVRRDIKVIKENAHV